MALQVEIKKIFPGFELDVAFETDGSCMGILGASGCGKSMTLKCIAGIEKPDSGRIVLNGRVLFDSERKINLSAQERRVGYLFQNYALFPTMTVEENLSIVLGGRRKGQCPEIQEQIRRFRLEGLEQHYPSQLSGGQQQRVALARMLLYHPEMILLDEPFSALDGFLKDTLQLEMMDVIREYRGDVVMVSHSRDEIFKLCAHTMIMAEGRSIITGTTRDVFYRPQHMEAARLTGCKNISVIRRVSAHELYAVDWEMPLHTEEEIGDEIRYVGIRAHNLVPVSPAFAGRGRDDNTADGKQKGNTAGGGRDDNTADEKRISNVMQVKQTGYAETPFTRQFLFCNAEGERRSNIWWLQDKPVFKNPEEELAREPFPTHIRFPEDAILLLK